MAQYTLMQKTLLWIGGKILINGRISDAVIKKVNDALNKHKQTN